MAGLVLGGTVGLAKGVEMGTSRGATVGVVTKLMDVEATLSVGIIAADFPGDGGGVGSRGLLESDNARDGGISTDDSN